MQHLLSVPLLDGITKNHINSIFSCIHQMAALQLLQQRSSSISKSMVHIIAQCLRTNNQAVISAYARSTWKCNYRFLDIQKVSNKLRIALVVHRAALSYSNVYKSVSTSGQREFLLSSG
ncbi:hypothetical protein AVEN_133936-1 [Araneus ventricosus]|uniref:Uncharacterized protein n=1 Tax=Araneus ventricosus TaxID=182803 RepID=A0A4Y2D4H8_ARAVE|nr:hypothetical protein AVEN_133936-1 [Araneus ventricosus]